MRNLGGQLALESTPDVDLAQLRALCLIVMPQCPPFDLDVGALGVCLGTHRHILACSHRQRAGGKSSKRCDIHSSGTGMRCRNAKHQAGDRKHPIIRAEHARTQPPRSMSAMSLWLDTSTHSNGSVETTDATGESNVQGSQPLLL